MSPSYETTPPRVILALMTGAIVGPLLVTTFFVTVRLAASPGYPTLSWADFGERLMLVASFASIVSFALFAVGILFLAAPLWRVMHHFGWHRPRHAVGLGAVLSFLCALALALLLGYLAAPKPGGAYHADTGELVVFDNRVTLRDVVRTAPQAAAVSVLGGIVGLVMWRVAYRRRPEPVVAMHSVTRQ